MSYLLETLGRGLLGRLAEAFPRQLPQSPDDDADALTRQRKYASTSTDLALREGTALLFENRWSEARRAFESARRIPAAFHAATLGLACVYDDLGRSAETLRLLESAQAENPDDPAIPFAIAICQERAGQTDPARDSYRRSLDLCPRLTNARERLAAIALRDNDLSRAIQQYEALSSADPDNVNYALTLATLQLQQGRSAEALRHFQDALLVEPETAGEVLDEVEQLHAAGHLEHAIGKLEKLVGKYPGVSEFHVHLGDLYVKAGQDGLAVRQYLAAVEICPSFLEANVKLGTQHLRSGRIDDAARVFNRAVELNDRMLIAFVGLGLAQCGVDRHADAIETWNLAVGLAPNSTLLLAESTRLHLKARQMRQRGLNGGLGCGDGDVLAPPDEDEILAHALSRYEGLILENPLRAEVHYRYAVLLRQMGETDRALGSLRRAATLAPSFVKAQVLLGLSLHEAGRRAEALDAFQNALSLRRSDLETHYQLGLLFSNRPQFDLVAERLGHQAESPRDTATVQSQLTLSLQQIGMIDRAESNWEGLAELLVAESPLTANRFKGLL